MGKIIHSPVWFLVFLPCHLLWNIIIAWPSASAVYSLRHGSYLVNRKHCHIFILIPMERDLGPCPSTTFCYETSAVLEFHQGTTFAWTLSFPCFWRLKLDPNVTWTYYIRTQFVIDVWFPRHIFLSCFSGPHCLAYANVSIDGVWLGAFLPAYGECGRNLNRRNGKLQLMCKNLLCLPALFLLPKCN